MKILLRSGKNDAWKPVSSLAYGAEVELQKLLAQTPSLVSLEEIRPGSSPLIVAIEEYPLPIGSIDLLAFTAEGDIAIIECKLAANSEIKRKVIGQVLEYAAYLWKMSYEDLDQKVKIKTGQHLADLLGDSFAQPEDEEVFRENIESALITGKFILVIVVDEINEELGRIVNYLNVCGNPSFAFSALEMRRYKKDELEMLVPHVLGVPQVKVTSSNSGRIKWDEDSFFQSMKTSQPEKVVELARDLYTWSQANASHVAFGAKPTGSFMYHLTAPNRPTSNVFCVYTDGGITLNFTYMSNNFTKETIDNFRNRMVSILTYNKSKKITQGYFGIRLEHAFDRPGSLEQFKQIVLSLNGKFREE
jgi:hypothetical protein